MSRNSDYVKPANRDIMKQVDEILDYANNVSPSDSRRMSPTCRIQLEDNCYSMPGSFAYRLISLEVIALIVLLARAGCRYAFDYLALAAGQSPSDSSCPNANSASIYARNSDHSQMVLPAMRFAHRGHHSNHDSECLQELWT